MWDRERLAWAAGIIEGEGWIGSVRERQTAVRLGVGVTMTDEDVIRSLRDVFGLGSVYGPYDRTRHGCRKPQFTWQATNRDAFAIVAAIWPWLHARRKDAVRDAVTAWTDAQRRRADPLRRFADLVASADGGCLIWLGHVTAHGAGAFYVAEHRKQSAHAYLYETRHPGETAPYCRKTCETPGCIEHWEPLARPTSIAS